VNAVAAVPMPDGRTLLAIGSDEGTVRLWDPLSSRVVDHAVVGASVSALTVVKSTSTSPTCLAVAGAAGLLMLSLD
ncbi:hypothetical protein ACFVAV_31600, partial [Nocardia sp. NPDC057663]|uniref:hypothetical protein n=1 Tax=Nocardia sp. NPDC057663 TaxID=3346201 RepID=UPI00366BEB9C